MMKLVRGRGRSIVESGSEENLKTRKLQTTERVRRQQTLTFDDFSKADDSFMLALWISVIDKIISKPTEEVKGKKEEKEEQKAKNALAKALRQNIGEAVLSGKIVRGNSTEFARQWNWKINASSAGKQNGSDYPKGRWYRAFLDDLPLEELQGARITELVHEISKHIHEATKSINGNGKCGSRGLLHDILAAVEKNTLKKGYETQFPAEKKKEPSFSQDDWQKYCETANKVKGGDFVKGLYEAALKGADAKAEVKPYYHAVEYLKNIVWPKVFGSIGRKEAAEQFPHLLTVHDAVKEFYKKTLKQRNNITTHNVAKKIGAKGKDSDKQIKKAIEKKLGHILPESADKLKWFCCKKHGNIDVNHYIRLGKVLHYEASRISDKNKQHDHDETAAIIKKWSDAVKELPDSFYWSSEGQTYIKQNEAFVRVWRRALAFANRTLKDWADPENKVRGDATISNTWEAMKADFSDTDFADKFGKKYELLFGKKWEGENQTEVLDYLQKRLVGLRGSVFHFKGMRPFIAELKTKKPPELMREFYKTSCESYRQKPIKIMQGAKFEAYFTTEQIQEILSAVQKWDAVSVVPEKNEKGRELDDGQSLPLPTLKRVLQRVKTAWEGEIDLPPYDAAAKNNEKAEKAADDKESSKDKEQREDEAAKHAQYIAIKMLYEKPFRAWVAALPTERVNGFIDKAVDRATNGAKNINGKKEGEFKELITARAAALPRLAHGQRIDQFFFNLTAATASEMRVQKDYQNDGKKAKEQAKYIENLKCDVVALALEAYLQPEKPEIGEGKNKKEVRFSYLTRAEFSLEELSKEKQDIDWKKILEEEASKKIDKGNRTFEPWLYFLLHLMPVEEVSSLRQQIRKWQITVGKTEESDAEKTAARAEAAKVRPLLQVFDLYIELHDEQFNTGEKQPELFDDDKEQLKLYYEGDFESIFAGQMQQEKLQAIRGLREMRRFGNKVLDKILHEAEHKVSVEAVDIWKNENDKDSAEYGKVAAAQKQRKELHKAWANPEEDNKKEWWHKKGKGKDTKYYLGKDGQNYVDSLKTITDHRHAVAQVELQNHLRLHKLLMAVLGRLVDFSGLFERDLYFTMLALFWENKVPNIKLCFKDRVEYLTERKLTEAFHKHKDKEQIKDFCDKIDLFFQESTDSIKENKKIGVAEDKILEKFLILNEEETKLRKILKSFFSIKEKGEYLEEGRIPEAFDVLRDEGDESVRTQLKDIFSFTAVPGEGATEREKYGDLANKDVRRWIRNRFAHLAILENQDIDLTRELNFARALMSYDRKLKNAVAQSIAEMLKRNNMEMRWQMGQEAKDPADAYVKIAYDKIRNASTHYLFGAQAESRTVYHLGQKGDFWQKAERSKNNPEKKNRQPEDKNLGKVFEEKLQCSEFVSMTQMLFGGYRTGTVKFFNAERGFGFIKPDDGTADIFVHISAVQDSGLSGLQEGQEICFEIESDKRGKGPKAVNLELMQ